MMDEVAQAFDTLVKVLQALDMYVTCKGTVVPQRTAKAALNGLLPHGAALHTSSIAERA